MKHFTKTIYIRVTGEAKTEQEFDQGLADYLETVRDMAGVYRESDYEVDIKVGDNEDQKWVCSHCHGWYFGTKAAGFSTVPCNVNDRHDYRPADE